VESQVTSFRYPDIWNPVRNSKALWGISWRKKQVSSIRKTLPGSSIRRTSLGVLTRWNAPAPMCCVV